MTTKTLLHYATCLVLVGWLGGGGGCSPEPAEGPGDAIKASTTALTSSAPSATTATFTPTHCSSTKTVSTAPGKPIKSKPSKCKAVSFKLPSMAYRQKQQQYLFTLSQKKAVWASLPAAAREAKRLALKRSILGN